MIIITISNNDCENSMTEKSHHTCHQLIIKTIQQPITKNLKVAVPTKRFPIT